MYKLLRAFGCSALPTALPVLPPWTPLPAKNRSWLFDVVEEFMTARWLERMHEYDFTVVHRPGKKHQSADALSMVLYLQCGQNSHVYLPISAVQCVVECTTSELRQ